MGSTKSLRSLAGKKTDYALVVDGKTLAFCLAKTLEKRFLRLTQMCNSVVCLKQLQHFILYNMMCYGALKRNIDQGLGQYCFSVLHNTSYHTQ
jgi:hypothetical protein